MAGKAPSRRKDKTRNSRPYDRPNQGIFGKVASKVKDLLTPSWLSLPYWIKTEEVDGSMPANEIDEDDLTENEEESTQIRPSSSKPRLPIRSVKRPRYDNNVSSVSIESTSPFWPGPSTSQERTVEEVAPTIPNCDNKKTDTPLLNNVSLKNSTYGKSFTYRKAKNTKKVSHLNDSRSHLSDSRLHLNDSHLHLNDSHSHLNDSHSHLSDSRTTLWSCGTQTSGKSFPQRPSISNRPSFNMSSFGRTSMMNNSPNLKIPSPFYEGNTTYGGASAYRKKSLAPYQINSSKSLRNQLKVKENTTGDGMECMSSAARRILHTLERMSTPITDAKRMPNVAQSSPDISLTIAPPSHRLKSYLTASSTPAVSSKGPPLVNLSAVSKVPLLKNRNSRITRNSMMEIPIRQCSPSPSILERDTAPVPKEPEQKKSPPPQTSSISPAAGGKMKTKRHCIHSSMERTPEECFPEYDLPEVPFPLKGMPILNLESLTAAAKKNSNSSVEKKSEEPLFTFSKPIEYSVPQPTISSPKTTVASSFKFSPPLVIAPEKKCVQKTDIEEPKKSEGIILSGSVNDVLKNMREKEKSPKSKEQDKSAAKKKDSIMTTNNGPISNIPAKQFNSNFGDSYVPKFDPSASPFRLVQEDGSAVECVTPETPKLKVAETTTVDKTSAQSTSVKANFKVQHESGRWECKTCRVRNTPSATKCVACEASAPASTTKRTFETGFGDKFKPQTGTWECSSCLVRNVQSAKTCVACKAPNPNESQEPAGFGDKFKPQTGTWECSVCLIRNVQSAEKCVACETPNPSPSKELTGKNVQKDGDPKKLSITSEGGKLVQNTAGTWECDTCLVRNAASSTKCAACETLKSSNGKTSNDAKFGFKFGANAQNSSTTFTFGSLISTSVPTSTTSTFKFGVPDNTSKTTADVAITESGFKFGSPANISKSTTDVAVSETGFKFGVPTNTSKQAVSTTASETGFKFVVPSQTSESGFKFGVSPQTTEVSTKTVTTLELKDSNKRTLSSLEDEKKPEKPAEIFEVWSPSTPLTTTGEKTVLASSSDVSNANKPLVFRAHGFKFGMPSFEKADVKETKLEEGQQQTQPPPSIAPTSTFGSSISTMNSTAVTENCQKTSDNIAYLNPLKPVAPFTFGASTNSVASSVSLGGNSNVSSFGQFGNNSSKPQEPSPFKMVDNKSMISGLSATSGVAKTSTTIATSAIPSFSFGKPPAFNAFSTSSPASKTDTNISNEALQQTIASSMPISGAFTTSASTPSTFVFGSLNPAASTTTSTFTFGTPSQAAPSSMVPMPSAANANAFAFGSTTTANETKPGFSLPTTTNHDQKSLFAVPKLSAFGTANAPAVATPFKFGATPPQAPTGNFGFPAPKLDTASTPGKFTFGGAPASTPSTFTAFQPQQPPTTAAFNFGSNSSSAFKPAAKFTFGAKSGLNSPANPPSVFGAPAAPMPVFGGNTSSPAFGNPAAPAFGAMSSARLPEPTGGFTFTAAPASASTPFVFGAPVEKKAAPGPAPSSGFNFMAAPQAPQPPDASGSFSASFNMSTPQNFNFGATSTPTNQPFQFAAVGEGSGNAAPTAAAGTRRFRRAVRRGIRKD